MQTSIPALREVFHLLTVSLFQCNPIHSRLQSTAILNSCQLCLGARERWGGEFGVLPPCISLPRVCVHWGALLPPSIACRAGCEKVPWPRRDSSWNWPGGDGQAGSWEANGNSSWSGFVRNWSKIFFCLRQTSTTRISGTETKKAGNGISINCTQCSGLLYRAKVRPALHLCLSCLFSAATCFLEGAIPAVWYQWLYEDKCLDSSWNKI